MTQTTLRQHLQAQQTDTDLMILMEDIATACRMIADRVRHGAFAGVLGAAETENVQGETQKELDVISDELFQQVVTGCTGLRGSGRSELAQDRPTGWRFCGLL